MEELRIKEIKQIEESKNVLYEKQREMHKLQQELEKVRLIYNTCRYQRRTLLQNKTLKMKLTRRTKTQRKWARSSMPLTTYFTFAGKNKRRKASSKTMSLNLSMKAAQTYLTSSFRDQRCLQKSLKTSQKYFRRLTTNTM